MKRASHNIALVSLAAFGLGACDHVQGPLSIQPGLYETSQKKIITKQEVEFDFSTRDGVPEEVRYEIEPDVIFVPTEPLEVHQVWQECMSGDEFLQMSVLQTLTASLMGCELSAHEIGKSMASTSFTCPQDEGFLSSVMDVSIGEPRTNFKIMLTNSGEVHGEVIERHESIRTGTYLGPCEEGESPPAP